MVSDRRAAPNIRPHANATKVTVDVGYGTNFSLCFSDNGVGIEPDVVDKERKVTSEFPTCASGRGSYAVGLPRGICRTVARR